MSNHPRLPLERLFEVLQKRIKVDDETSYHDDSWPLITKGEARQLLAACLGAPQEPSAQYLSDVADRIIETDGCCAHDWLVGVAKHLKACLAAAVLPPSPHHDDCECSQCRSVALPAPPHQQREPTD